MICIMNLATKPFKEPLMFGHWMNTFFRAWIGRQPDSCLSRGAARLPTTKWTWYEWLCIVDMINTYINTSLMVDIDRHVC
jgi:hypothetical protein